MSGYTPSEIICYYEQNKPGRVLRPRTDRPDRLDGDPLGAKPVARLYRTSAWDGETLIAKGDLYNESQIADALQRNAIVEIYPGDIPAS